MCSNKTSLTYRDAGVDIDAGNRAVEFDEESVETHLYSWCCW